LLDRSPETRWQAAGEQHEITYGDGLIRVTAQNEAGKISLNEAPDEMLADLFRTLGETPADSAALAASIVQWRETRRSEWASASALGAEGADAQAAEPFQAMEEFRLVPGVTDALYQRVSRYLTVYSDNALVDPLTAPAEVLRSLRGLSAQQIDAYIADRTQRGGPVSVELPAVPGLSPFLADPVERTVTITSEGQTASGTRFVREAVAATTGAGDQPYRFLVWRQARSREDE